MIVPLADGEEAWRGLLSDLSVLGEDDEVVLASSSGAAEIRSWPVGLRADVRQTREGRGRAGQMNAGARSALGERLWFLHADSRLAATTFPALLRSVREHPDGLLYADLVFARDATPLTTLNQAGAWARSRLLGLPFGDQGFCLTKSAFESLGGYPEDAPYGEDHLLVWRARQSGRAVRPIRAPLLTSARKYRDRGWLNTTCLHVGRTVAQAWPQWRLTRTRRSAA